MCRMKVINMNCRYYMWKTAPLLNQDARRIIDALLNLIEFSVFRAADVVVSLVKGNLPSVNFGRVLFYSHYSIIHLVPIRNSPS